MTHGQGTAVPIFDSEAGRRPFHTHAHSSCQPMMHFVYDLEWPNRGTTYHQKIDNSSFFGSRSTQLSKFHHKSVAGRGKARRKEEPAQSAPFSGGKSLPTAPWSIPPLDHSIKDVRLHSGGRVAGPLWVGQGADRHNRCGCVDSVLPVTASADGGQRDQSSSRSCGRH